MVNFNDCKPSFKSFGGEAWTGLAQVSFVVSKGETPLILWSDSTCPFVESCLSLVRACSDVQQLEQLERRSALISE